MKDLVSLETPEQIKDALDRGLILCSRKGTEIWKISSFEYMRISKRSKSRKTLVGLESVLLWMNGEKSKWWTSVV